MEYNSPYEICPTCRRLSNTVELRRMNTAYYDDTANHSTQCEECHELEWEYNNERWEEYYESLGL